MNTLYEKVRKFIPEVEWAVHEPLVEKINKLTPIQISKKNYLKK